jgi:hypothetical protein
VAIRSRSCTPDAWLLKQEADASCWVGSSASYPPPPLS